MSEANLVTETRRLVHLTVKVLLISMGFLGLALATTLEGAPVVLAVFLGGAVIASAFLGLPRAIVSRALSDRATQPRKEAYYAIGVPLAASLFMGWQTYQDLWHVSTISLFVEPQWTDFAQPVLHGLVALMNLAVFVSNLVSLRRMRAKP
jgi:TRAP-type C4-dicarboxylate transport system permease small subunit